MRAKTRKQARKNVISMIQKVISIDLANALQSIAFYSAVEETDHKCVREHPSVDPVVTNLVDAPSFTVPVAKFVKQEVDKKPLKWAMMDEQFVKPAEKVDEKKIMIGDGVPTKRIDPFEPQAHRGTYSMTKELIQRRTVQKRLPTSRNSALPYPSPKQKEQALLYSPPSPLPHPQ